MTANADLGNIDQPISTDNLNTSSSSIDSCISSSGSTDTSQLSSSKNGNNEDLFQIAAKAEKLLQEILSAGKKSPQTPTVKQEPQAHVQINVPPPVIQHNPVQQPQYLQNGQLYANQAPTYYQQQIIPVPQLSGYSTLIPQPQFGFQAAPQSHPVNFMRPPPPNNIIQVGQGGIPQQTPYYYQMRQQPLSFYAPNVQQYHTGYPSQQPSQAQYHINSYIQRPPPQCAFSQNPSPINSFNKRKFGEINNYPGNSNNVNNRIRPEHNYNSYQSQKKFSNGGTKSEIGENAGTSSESPSIGVALTEDDDLNLIRERELKDLKCKSIVEKMSVFLKYYQQFKEAYIHRVYTIECSDSLKVQFHSLIKYLNEYEALLAELDMVITEHERDHCKNNHRKTKKFFNKTKAFIRYECNKRLQSNIFEYRRLINSQDRYAGMYDLLDMNSYLISLLPDIGVSIRRYINRCEKAKEQAQLEADEEEDTFQAQWEENSNDSNMNDTNHDSADITIPTFKEFVAIHGDDDDPELSLKRKRNEDEGDDTTLPAKFSKEGRAYDSFSMGVDSLNRYLLKRVEDEETLDELVKERIIKWINKRQAKYILIFCEVDKLLNQHKSGECYPKFHSYLLFNLGKLVTVCDSYHQKLKELLYSTTIRRKKKRKKVKLLPEAMSDVFDEIIDLKRALEHAKIAIKKCNGKAQQLQQQQQQINVQAQDQEKHEVQEPAKNNTEST